MTSKKYLVVIKQEGNKVYSHFPIYRSAETKEEAEDIIRMWKYPIKMARIFKEIEE
jgi:hypothetical protein